MANPFNEPGRATNPQDSPGYPQSSPYNSFNFNSNQFLNSQNPSFGNSFGHGSTQYRIEQAQHPAQYQAQNQYRHTEGYNKPPQQNPSDAQPAWQSPAGSPRSYEQNNSLPTPQIQQESGGFGQGDNQGFRYVAEETAAVEEYVQQKLPATNIEIARQDGGTQCWESLRAMGDTGTELNWINRQTAIDCGLQINAGVAEEWMTFDGKTFSSFEFVRSTWSVSGAAKTHRTEFRVIPNAPFDALFGRNYLEHHAGELEFMAPGGAALVLVRGKSKKSEEELMEENRARKEKESAELARYRQQEESGGSSKGQKKGNSSNSGRKERKK
ncbi:hypothetical protein G7Y89_g9784 [Cudoniella acicularis]|uniref:Uncharacterized protein n=1 Tax=Cudoniella acicularis TaxID=354080 RepID=A0A8H4W1J7_9HELO|nr:hypothetical protein G7Y89_g9784 [Cudoniella acicularis]